MGFLNKGIWKKGFSIVRVRVIKYKICYTLQFIYNKYFLLFLSKKFYYGKIIKKFKRIPRSAKGSQA